MRREFSKAVKLAAWARSNGRCECGCGFKILGRAEFDHYPVPASLGGSATLDNCRVLDKKHHRQITAAIDQPEIAKSQRIYEKRIGARRTKRPFPRRVDPWGKRAD